METIINTFHGFFVSNMWNPGDVVALLLSCADINRDNLGDRVYTFYKVEYLDATPYPTPSRIKNGPFAKLLKLQQSGRADFRVSKRRSEI